MRKSFITLFLATLTISGLTACNSHTHSYDVENPVWQWTQYSAATVTFTCLDCEDTVEGHSVTENATITEKETVKATCEEDGHKVYEASATFQDVVYTNSKTQTLPKLGHSEDTSKWEHNETSHWHNCVNCGDAHHFSTEEHTFSEWKVTKEADHYTKGTKERYCTVCKYTENEDIEMTKFTYAEVKALHDKFATFTDTKSYFISHAAEDLAYSIDNIDPNEKTGHESELTEWATAANEAKTYFNENFSVVFDSEAMDTYSKTVSTREFYNGYGSVLKVNGDATKFEGEGTWDVGSNRQTTFDNDIEALVFAVYNSQPMNVTLINSNSSEHVVPFYTNGTILTNKEVTCAANQWTEFHFYVSDVTKLDEFYIGLYLTNGQGYGIPTTDEATTRGSGYITEVIGVKSTYYKSLAATVVTLINNLTTLDLNNITLDDGTQINAAKNAYDALPLPAQKYVTNLETLQKYVDAYNEVYNKEQASGVVTKIESLKTLNKDNLTLWNGGQILEVRNAYDALPDTVKSYVTNYSALEEYETAYKALGTAHNTEWQASSIHIVPSFDSTTGYDDQYGLYTEFNNITTTWVGVFSPVSNQTIDDSAKVMFYNPQTTSTVLYLYNNDSWGGWGEFEKTANPGWNEIDLPLAAFKNGSVNGISIALANATQNSGFKLTSIYTVNREKDAESIKTKIDALKSLDKTTLSLWNGGQIFEARSEYDALPEAAKKYVTNYSTLTEYETAYATIGTAYNISWNSSTLNGKSTAISSSTIGYDDTYGLYNELSGTDDGYVFNVQPVTSLKITNNSVKFAIYNPIQNSDTVVYFISTNSSWSPTITTGTTEGYNNLKYGWNEYEIPYNYFNDGLASGLTVSINTKSASGYKFTPIYQAA